MECICQPDGWKYEATTSVDDLNVNSVYVWTRPLIWYKENANAVDRYCLDIEGSTILSTTIAQTGTPGVRISLKSENSMSETT